MVAIRNYSDTTGLGVKDSLSVITVTPQLVSYLKDKREQWKTFGRMNSHLYRKQLFDRMDALKLSGEARMLVFAMASVIKSQPRIIQAMTDMPESEQFTSPGVWFAVLNFYKTETVQYVTGAKKQKKFPVVNLPTTLPGLDILLFCLITEDAERTLENLIIRPTFTQIHLRADAQTRAKEGYTKYWSQIVKGTRNEDKTEAPKMNEVFYETSAADKYLLYSLNKSNQLVEVTAVDKQNGYSLTEIESYLRSFNRSSATSTGGTGSAGTTSSA